MSTAANNELKCYVAHDMDHAAPSSAEIGEDNMKAHRSDEELTGDQPEVPIASGVDQDSTAVVIQGRAGGNGIISDLNIPKICGLAKELFHNPTEYSAAARHAIQVAYEGMPGGGEISACLKDSECWRRNAAIVYPHIREAGEFAYSYARDHPWLVGLLVLQYTPGTNLVATSVLNGVGFGLKGIRAGEIL